ncbi:MAG: hypothetical protein ACOYNL_02450 [Rickettsiales bacterium]
MGMMRAALVTLIVLSVASCGVPRPLIRPKEVPAYEEQQRKKRERIEQEQREMEQEQLLLQQQRTAEQPATEAQ